ncbi:MAG: ABC transporter permease, partial [Ruminococcus sp.]|nr:ABC transporter permease [Ruminococcus sp.]
IFPVAAIFSGIIAVVVSASNEFTNGINKNKLTCGHSRLSIYISEYIISVLLCLSLFAVFLIFSVPYNIPKLIKNLGSEFLPLIGGVLLMMLAYTAVFYAIVNFVPYRGAVAVIIAFIFAGISVYDTYKLESIARAKPYYDRGTFENGYEQILERVYNDDYIPHDSPKYWVIDAAYRLDPGVYVARYFELYEPAIRCGKKQITCFHFEVREEDFGTFDEDLMFKRYRGEVVWLFVTTGLFLCAGWLGFFRRNLK